MLFEIREIPPGTSESEKSFLARRALGALLAEYYGIAVLPPIEKDTNGKPFFPDRPDIHFSLSHCKAAVMAAVDRLPIGCDVEDIQEDAPAELLDLGFSEAEKKRILVAGSPALALTEIWTRKEAIAKRSGLIPDDPRSWRSDDPTLTTRVSLDYRYVFSIAVTDAAKKGIACLNNINNVK